MAELHQLLSLYSRNVASGEWRDYAIDQLGGSAAYSVFLHTHDAPLYSIAKQGNSRAVEYVVFSGREKLKRAKTLSDVLRSEEHTSELQSLMRISYAVFCLKKKKKKRDNKKSDTPQHKRKNT